MILFVYFCSKDNFNAMLNQTSVNENENENENETETSRSQLKSRMFSPQVSKQMIRSRKPLFAIPHRTNRF